MAYPKLQAGRAAAVTPSDTENIPNVATEDGSGNNGCVLYVGGTEAGTLTIQTVGGDDVTLTGVQPGTFIPIQVLKVYDTDTSVIDIIALW
jgi:hypothetical protein